MLKNELIITWGKLARKQSVKEEDYFATFRCLKLENIKCNIVRLDSKPFQLKFTDRDPHQQHACRSQIDRRALWCHREKERRNWEF